MGIARGTDLAASTSFKKHGAALSPAGWWPSIQKLSRQWNLSGSLTPCWHFILVACDPMCRNKHRAAASKFLLLQPLEDFLQVLFSAYYSSIFWLTVAGFSWYVNLPEDMFFSELPLQKDGPHNPGTPTELTSCFSVLSSSCFPSARQGLAVPFSYPSTLLVVLLHQQMTWSSSYSGPFPSFWLADSTALLILLSPLSLVPCYLTWSVFRWGSCLCFSC